MGAHRVAEAGNRRDVPRSLRAIEGAGKLARIAQQPRPHAMRVLFITRAFPPVVGGIENHNHALSVWLPHYATVRTLANRRGKRALAWFLPFATLFALVARPRYDVVLLGDGVLAITGWIIKRLQPRQKVVCVVHGLDLIWPARWYQRLWVRRFLPALDGLIAVSAQTRHQALAHGLAAAAITVIPNGIETETLVGNYVRENLARCLGRDITHTQVLLTAGRLARRKGAAWFIREVLPQLAPNTLYVLAGAGPALAEIQTAIRDTKLQDRVLLLGQVSDATRNLLLNTVDVFVQPNIPVAGDMEGFGIAVLEAAVCGRPVVAAALEGLLDAITPQENGLLVAPAVASLWVSTLNELLADPQARHRLGTRAAQYTHQHHHWRIIAARYAAAIGHPGSAQHTSTQAIR